MTVEVVQELLGARDTGEGCSRRKEGLDLAREFPGCDNLRRDFASNQLFGAVSAGKSRSRMATAYFILLTTADRFEEAQELDAPFDDFLFKPIVKQELLGRVRASKRSRELRAQLDLTQQELQQSREQMLQSEKMSSLGVGIWYRPRINNPITLLQQSNSRPKLATDLIELLRLYQKELSSRLGNSAKTARYGCGIRFRRFIKM